MAQEITGQTLLFNDNDGNNTIIGYERTASGTKGPDPGPFLLDIKDFDWTRAEPTTNRRRLLLKWSLNM